MKKSNIYYSLAWGLIILGIATTIYFLVFLKLDGWQFWGSGVISLDRSGQFGDYIGGFVGTLFSLSGFIFLYLTLKEQREAFRSERFETRFFEMVKFHRENVDKMNMEIDKHNQNDRVVYTGQQCLKIIFQQLTEIRNDLRPFFKKRDENQIYLKEYYDVLTSEAEIRKRKISLKQIAKIDVAYNIVFYGTDYYGMFPLRETLSKKYTKEFVMSILDYIALKPVRSSGYFEKWNSIQGISSFAERINVANRIYYLRNRTSKSQDANLQPEDAKYFYRDDYIKYYGGHQIRLAHYFRHLFQTVNLVEEQRSLSYREKYNYVKLLRAQMSTFEQIIFFFNSMSSLGDVWELRASKNYSHYTFSKKEALEINRQLITKYNLIKNLSDGQLLRMRFATHYPDVTYEFSELTEKRKQLELLYT